MVATVATAGALVVPAAAEGMGPVVETSASDVLVDWGSHVVAAQAAAAAGLLDALDGSGYLHGLASAYPVTASAAYVGAGIVRDADLPATVDDTTIASTLATRIAAGGVPAPTGFTNYVVMLPPGVTPASSSPQPQPFCSSHRAFTAGATRAYVIVVADYTDTAKQCGDPASAPEEATTLNLSRELVDTITDPESTNGVKQTGTTSEIGDACTVSATPGNVDGYAVQRWWSNSASTCSVGTVGVGVARDVGTITNAQQATFLLHDTEGSSRQQAFSCTLDGAGVDCGTTDPLSVTGLSAGPHRLVVSASGVGQATSAWLVDLAAPVATLVGPTAPVTVGKTVTVTFSGTDTGGAGVAAYDVRYRTAAWNGGFGGWVRPTSWEGTPASHVTMAVKPGHEYCFSVRARDRADNTQPSWSSSRCTAVPVDDRTLTATKGWKRAASATSFRGTLTVSSTRAARLRLPQAHVRQLALLVSTCSGCGRINIYLSGVLWRSVDTHSRRAHTRVLLFQPGFSLRIATIWLQVAAGGKPVYIDGVAICQN